MTHKTLFSFIQTLQNSNLRGSSLERRLHGPGVSGVCRKEQYLAFHIAGAIGCPGSGLGQIYCQEAVHHSTLAWRSQALLSLLSSDTFSLPCTYCGFLFSPLSVETGPKRRRAHQLPSTSNNSASPLGPTFCSPSPAERKTRDPYPLLKFI